MRESFRFRAGAAPPTLVVAGAGALPRLGRELPRIAPGRWLLVSSVPVFRRHGARLLSALPAAAVDPRPVLVADGEAAKSWESLGRLLQDLVGRGLKRDGGVVALGGGTVGDVAGLAASLVLRGVPVVQVPTTLLAASDSALGGKTAVNLPEGKNLAGTFHHPRVVAVEPSFLATLSSRDWRSGLAEVVKSALLDPAFFRRFEALLPSLLTREPSAVAEAVLRSLAMKARVVAADPDEASGKRYALNLGHTVAHALEAASGHRLAHGEAVAWGLLAAIELSQARAGLSIETAERARRWVVALRPPPIRPEWAAAAGGFLGADKKADRRGPRAVLLAAAGRALTVRVGTEEVLAAFQAARSRYNGRRHGVPQTAEDPDRHGPPRRLRGGRRDSAPPVARPADRDQP